jgi:ATP-dependent DNA helicase RecG
MGFSNLQHEQMVLSYVRQHGSVRRSDIADLCRLTSIQARDLLKRQRQSGRLQQYGERRAAFYVLGDAEWLGFIDVLDVFGRGCGPVLDVFQ